MARKIKTELAQADECRTPAAYSRREHRVHDRSGARRQRARYGHSTHTPRSRSRIPNRNAQDTCVERDSLFVEDEKHGQDDEDDAWSDCSLEVAIKPEQPEPTSNTLEPASCICPVSKTCPGRDGNLIDCRTLVVEKEWWTQWDRTTKGPPYVRFFCYIPVELIYPSPGPAADPSSGQQATLKHVLELAVYINILRQNPPSTSRRTQIKKIMDWIAAMFTLSLSPEVLQVVTDRKFLFGIGLFLADHNHAFRRLVRLPISIEEDLQILLRKWTIGDGSMVPNRGLLTRNGVRRIDKTYVHYQDPRVYGNNNLINGQRFRSRIQMMRDGGHTRSIAGICGTLEEGAYSIVMGYHNPQQGQFYADIDLGEIIHYCGTALRREVGDKEATNVKDRGGEVARGTTRDTKILKRSIRTKKPVRVFRSSYQASICPHRPMKHLGKYRYDGLYQATSYQRLKKNRGICRFRLQRLPGQGPIREW